MLRAGLFVDLYQVVRHACAPASRATRSSSWSRSTAFARDDALADANAALAELQADLELDDAPSISRRNEGCGSRLQQGRLPFRRRAARLAGSASEVSSSQSGTEVPRPAAGRRRAERKDHRLADQDQRSDRASDGRYSRRPAGADRGAAGALDSGQYPRLAPARRKGGVVGTVPAWRTFRPKTCSMSAPAFPGWHLSATPAARPRRRSIATASLPQETDLRGGEDLRNLGGDKLGKVEAISFRATARSTSRSGRTPPALHPRGHLRAQYVDTQVDEGGAGPARRARRRQRHRRRRTLSGGARSPAAGSATHRGRTAASREGESTMRGRSGSAAICSAASCRSRDRRAPARPSPARG